MNQAGKEILIKSVLQAVPTYAMAILRFPKSFCKSICSSIARFWWRSNGKIQGIHWKSWTDLAKSKSIGGIGFKDFSDMNSALLSKQAWRVIRNPQALWVRVLKANYFPNTDFIRARRKRNESWVWASLIHGRDMVLKSARWSIGSGESILIADDNWLANGKKVENHGINGMTKVVELVD